MNKLILSAGVVAAGAMSVQAAGYGYAPGFGSTDLSQPWSVAVTLRGFYDDNYLTASDGSPAKRDSFGFSVSPSGSVAMSTGQTDAGLKYTFGAYFYEDRSSDEWDLRHMVDGFLTHYFSERADVYLNESFLYTSEPELLEGTTPYRSEWSYMRNSAQVNLNLKLTEMMGVALGYANTWFDYEDKGVGSFSALLDRWEHLWLANLRWQLRPQTVGVLGYNFGWVDFTSDDPIAPGISADIRNSYNHYIYVGADHTFNPQLSGGFRAGALYADFYNNDVDSSEWAPYGELNLRYQYGTLSYVDLGLQQRFSQTDVRANNSSATVVYGAVHQAFGPKLVGSLVAKYQYSEFNGRLGPYNYEDKSENWFSIGVNFAYEIDRHISAEVGYSFDKLDSEARNDFDRNRVYLGVKVAY